MNHGRCVCAEILDVRAERNISIGMARGRRKRGGVLVLLQVNSQTSQSSESVGLAALFTLCRQL